MLNRLWPTRLETPHFELGSSFAEGLRALRLFGEVREETDEKEGHSARVDTSQYSVALYEGQGRIKAVWYDDRIGRWSNKTKGKKLGLYLQRFTKSGTWNQTLDNGFMVFWHNEEDERVLVYGLHRDVIRINDLASYEDA
ncbi:MAG TPA: hypothetical protein VD994_12640 [Prosthecobacter sp.]|nr:hypothetical protein [Prosthecobacter sp.]